MRTALLVLLGFTILNAQLPECNMLVVVEHGVVAERPQNGLYHYSTLTDSLTRLWPPPGSTAGWTEAVKAAQYSPDMTQVAFYKQQDRLAIIDRDGANPRLIDLGRPFKASYAAFAWTEQGIFWYDKDTYELLRFQPESMTVSVVCTLNYLPSTTSFGGVLASRDGSRMWSWLTLSGTPENDPGRDQTKPFIYIENNDYDHPIIRNAYKWGHGNMMLPDGSKTLHIGWEFSNNTHPYIWIWNWDTFTQDSTLEHGVPISAARGCGLVQVANSSEWIGMMFEGSANYLWQWAAATSGAHPILMDLDREYYNLAHLWLGPYPDVQGVWHVAEAQILVTTDNPTDTIHLSNWSDSGEPDVQTDRTWTGTPTVSVDGSDVGIVFTVTNGPVLPDTALVTITDSEQTSRTCPLVWAPSQTPAEQLTILSAATETTVELSWQNTLGPQFTFAVQRSDGGSGWGPPVGVDSSYTDNSPAEGDNRYRVAAIAGADTSYQEVTVYYAASASITILSPLEAQQFAAGAQVLVQWSTVKVPSVQISVSPDGGETFLLMTQSSIDIGDSAWANYTITLPSVVSSAMVIKVHPYQQTEPCDTVSVSTTASAVGSRPLAGVTRAVPVVRYYYDLVGRRIRVVGRALPATPVIPAIREGTPELLLPMCGN